MVMDCVTIRSFSNEIEKIAKEDKYDAETMRMSNAFYLANKRLNKEKKSEGRKKLLIGAGGVGLAGVGVYGVNKLGLTDKLKNKAKDKLYSISERVGREAGINAGKATNAAGDAYAKTLKSGAKNVSKKIRGGEFITKIIKKIMFKK